jgi:hypothetical protein
LFPIAFAHANAPLPNDSRAFAIAHPWRFGIFTFEKTNISGFSGYFCESFAGIVAFQRQYPEKACS